jgi:hypothetical protein
MSSRISLHDKAAARAVAAWVHRKTPDELGTLVDSIWSLGRAAPDWSPELAEHARALMEIGLNGEVDPHDPRAVVALAELLDRAAGTLRSAARILSERDDSLRRTGSR